ncbi:hypothetical protein D9M68_575790 [compost metagenome]
MDNVISFFQENSGWLLGGGGLVGAVLAVWKLFLNKPSIQQTQTVNGGGKAYQAGRDVRVIEKKDKE